MCNRILYALVCLTLLLKLLLHKKIKLSSMWKDDIINLLLYNTKWEIKLSNLKWFEQSSDESLKWRKVK